MFSNTLKLNPFSIFFLTSVMQREGEGKCGRVHYNDDAKNHDTIKLCGFGSESPILEMSVHHPNLRFLPSFSKAKAFNFRGNYTFYRLGRTVIRIESNSDHLTVSLFSIEQDYLHHLTTPHVAVTLPKN